MRRLTLKSCGHSGTDRVKSHTVSIHTTVGTNQLSDRKRIQTVEDEIDVLCGRLLLAHVKCSLECPLNFTDPFIQTDEAVGMRSPYGNNAKRLTLHVPFLQSHELPRTHLFISSISVDPDNLAHRVWNPLVFQKFNVYSSRKLVHR